MGEGDSNGGLSRIASRGGIVSEALEVSRLSFDELAAREWLVSNGLGGYASSTVPCINTRKYHGLLVAAMAPPVRRMVLLSRLEETFFHQGRRNDLACNEYPGTIFPQGYKLLRAFSVDPFPRWAYQSDGWPWRSNSACSTGEMPSC